MGQLNVTYRENPFTERVATLSADDFELLAKAVEERGCRDEIGMGTFVEAAGKFMLHPKCPGCGCERPMRDGKAGAGVQRWRCPACGRRHSSLTGTVFEHARYDLPKWVSLIRPMRYNAPIECAAEAVGITHQTAWEWGKRVFATADGSRTA